MMKVNLKRSAKQPVKKDSHFIQSNNYTESIQENKAQCIVPCRLFSPENSTQQLHLMKSFTNGSKQSKPKLPINSLINNSSNWIHIDKILGQPHNTNCLEKPKHFLKSNTAEIEANDYLRTEPTPSSTANTTNIDSIMNRKNYSKQKSYKKMVEVMMKSKFISSSLKSMDVLQVKSSSPNQSNPSSKFLQHNKTRDKSSYFLSSDNTIDKDNDSMEKGFTYKDLIQCNKPPELSLNVLKKSYQDYPKSIEFSNQIGFIKGYGVNTYRGLFKEENEDRVSIIQNVPKPKNYKDKWPLCFLLGVYDGHGGKVCANYLKDHLLNYIIRNNSFPNDPVKAIEKGFEKAESEFLNDKCINSIDSYIKLSDESGSCAIVIVIVDKMCYIASLGNSRALVSINKGASLKVLSIEHSTSNREERKRVEMNGGTIYQTKLSLGQFIVKDEDNHKNSFCDQMLYGPDRILPGSLSITRSIGDPKAKLPQFGGKSYVISATPSIFSYEITAESDFIILGSDGIFERMSNKEVIDAAWLVKRTTNGYSQCVDMLIKTSLERNAIDNLTAVLIDLKPTTGSKTSIDETKLEIHGIYETIDQKYCRRSHQSPGSFKTPSFTVKKTEKSKIMPINN